ncbi:muscle, skeletal receptor tyrosine protein kinase-like [Anneissia japonica]|uniref:muscle, skeletal receptor tyrosine protein kinase-like n=1 Tax=Anneissia japonica TaxID=1529436 RepID=UPI0014258458|nr:muscle, skeletal receptor tyrosine protein kinase-like [Anneissia japonica]
MMGHSRWILTLIIVNVFSLPISCDVGGSDTTPTDKSLTQAVPTKKASDILSKLLTLTPKKNNATLPVPVVYNPSPPTITKHPENVTGVEVGDLVVYHCQVIGEVDEMWWEQNGQRIYIRKREKIKLQNVSLADAGTYQCVARNKYGTVRSKKVVLVVYMRAKIVKGPGINNVEYGQKVNLTCEAIVRAKIVKGPGINNVEYGQKVNLTCEAIGYPKPNIAWKERGSFQVDYSTGRNYDKPYLIVTAVGPINYTCYAENKIIIDGKKRRSFVESVGVIKISNRPDPQGYCSLYHGNVCSPYLRRRFVFYNTSIPNPRTVIDSTVLEIKGGLDKVSDNCYEPMLKILCHKAYPDCDQVMPGLQLSKPLCREECYAFKLMYCRNEWSKFFNSLTVKHKQLIQIPDNCGELPSKFNSTPDHIQCSDSDILQLPDADDVTKTCYNESGQYYQGSVNFTQSGLACQPWEAQHFMNHNMHPELFNASNFCRNPNGKYHAPWCFTEIIMPRWEYCAIDRCDADVSATRLPLPQPTKKLPFDISWIVIICCTSLVIIVIMIISLTGILHVRRNKKLDKLYPFPTNLNTSEIPLNPMYGKDFYQSFNPRLETFEYPRNDVIYIKDIGEGAFGRVFQARVPHLVPDEKETIVAVKMLKDDADADTMRYFNREAEVITRFNHQNIVKLLGVCFVGKPLSIILEYMGHGDLQHFLRRRSPERIYEGSNKNGMVLDMRTKLKMAKQVAAGMAYLTELRFVHRDVATRNCLVNSMLEVKISDFGLARHLGSREYYLGHKDEKIPIRWTSPEALWDYQFTYQSDVWSFGILLWEIFTNALKPYNGMSHEEVFMKVRQGYRLGCSKDTPKDVYEIMKNCWAAEASDRPSFQTVYSTLVALQEAPSIQQANDYAIV